MPFKDVMAAWRPQSFRRMLSYIVVVSCITAIELKVNGGISANGQLALMGISAAYFGSVAWDKVTQNKNGKANNAKPSDEARPVRPDDSSVDPPR